MDFYEAEIIRLQNRIKRIEEDPDPTKLKSNKIRYELELEEMKEKFEAWQQGKPSVDGEFVLGPLARAMGFSHPGGSRDAMFRISDAQKYLDLARTRGLPVNSSCDMSSVPFAMGECGDTRKQDFCICDQHSCTPMWLSSVFMSHTHKRFTYYFDIGFEENEANLRHVTDQLDEFIDFAEKMFPGVIKFDEDRLIELQTYSEAAQGYAREMYEMLKHKPSPIAGKDAFQQGGGATSAKGLEYIQARRDEMAERIEKRIAAVSGEKLRVIWTVTRPFFMDLFPILAKRKIALLLHYSGPTSSWVPMPRPTYWGDRKLSPLEKVAAHAISSLWARPGTAWVDNMIWICRDLKIDGIINYCMLGCTATLGLRKLIEDAAEKELGIPVLQLEGKQWDNSYANEATITTKLDEFAQMLLNQQGIA